MKCTQGVFDYESIDVNNFLAFQNKHNWILVQKTIITYCSWPLNSELTSVSSVIRSVRDATVLKTVPHLLFLFVHDFQFFSHSRVCVCVVPGCVGMNTSAYVPVALCTLHTGVYDTPYVCKKLVFQNFKRAEKKHLIVQKWIQIW